MARVVKLGKDNPWRDIAIKSWQEFENIVSELPRNQWVYRGHSSAEWSPETALFRAFKDASPIINTATATVRQFARLKHEELLIDRFKRSAHLYRQILPKDKDNLEWLSIMQHYGAPTRLLDVTLSPHIATYFAMESGHKESVIFAFDHTALRPNNAEVDTLRRNIFDKENAKSNLHMVLFVPTMTTERLLAQQGAFLVPSSISKSFESILAASPNARKACLRIVIPANLRLSGIQRLREMNLTSAALFPGIDGFCRSMRFQIFEPTQMQALLE